MKRMILIFIAILCINIACYSNSVLVGTAENIVYYANTDSLIGDKNKFSINVDTYNRDNEERSLVRFEFIETENKTIVCMYYEDGDYGGSGYVKYKEDNPVSNLYYLCKSLL